MIPVRVLVRLLAVAGAAALACAGPPPEYAEFERSSTRRELSDLIGKEPTTCVAADSHSELCSWYVGQGYPAWKTLAGSIGTRDLVVVLCVLPADGGARTKDSCTVHAARSRPLAMSEPTAEDQAGSGDAVEASAPADPGAARLEAERAQATRLLSNARTLVEISQLLGWAPDSCTATSAVEQMCLWRLTPWREGWAIAAALAGTTGRATIFCELPLRGGSRGPDSCRARPQ